ncbi:MAG: peptidyl-prolyl cis-trans isomerase [Clostridiales bacterium]|nr:peptidyl-prolyl cis-trans isomerase [Clostridiales bacterium]
MKKTGKVSIFTSALGAVLLLAMVLLLASCGSSSPIVSEVSGSQGYTDAQIRLVVATERNRYQSVYTKQIWQAEVDENGTTFEEYLTGQIEGFLKELKTMNLLADERELRVSGQEKEQLTELSQAYYDGLTEADLSYIGADVDDVYELYEEYYRANCLVDQLTQDVNLEISDSEARVVNMQEICVSDADTARQVYEAAAGGSDFLSLVRSYAENEESEVSIGRGERPSAYEDIVFSLEDGEISPVIALDGQYYIVRCLEDYDEAKTLERKEKLAIQRKARAFGAIYDAFAEEHPVELRGDVWREISFAEGGDSTTTNFFTLYKEYFSDT